MLNGTLNRGDLDGLRHGRIPLAPGTSFECASHGLVIDGESAFEDCAYVAAVPAEGAAARARRIEAMVTAMDAAYAGRTLALSYDQEESERGITALRSEWSQA